MAAQKPRQEQLCPRLAKAEVREELLTDRCSLLKKKISTTGKHTRVWRYSNSKKSCCLPIKCTPANTLAALMWRRPLNSVTLATQTHRRPKGVSDGISTQVMTQMINKCRARMVRAELYNVRDPPWRGDRKFVRESILTT